MKIGVQEQLDKISRNFCSVKYVFCIKPSSQETKTEVKGVNRELVRGEFLPFFGIFCSTFIFTKKGSLGRPKWDRIHNQGKKQTNFWSYVCSLS